MQAELDEILLAHAGEVIVFDAKELTYISSAGLRLLLWVQKKLGENKLVIRNVSKEVYDIFDMTQFTELMHVEKALREIDVTGAAVIGKGRSSTVYRIGDETIVKLYTAGVPLAKIRQEMDLAKKAFVAGIPTAISYDMVTTGDAYGVSFEMLDNADTVGHSITNHPEQFAEIMEKFVAVYKTMHSMDIEKMGGFTSLKDTWNKWAEGMAANASFTQEETERLKQLIAAIPERSTMVHCDFHAGNVMYQQGEIVVIDMADIGFGHPIFDLAAGAFHARLPFVLKFCAENLGVDAKLAAFSILVGVQLNKAGNCIFFSLVTLMLMRVYGIDMPVSLFLTLWVSVCIMAIAKPPIPCGGIICIAYLFTVVGGPAEAIAVILCVEPIAAMFNGVCNESANIATTFILAKKIICWTKRNTLPDGL